jgi:hypothetical protein
MHLGGLLRNPTTTFHLFFSRQVYASWPRCPCSKPTHDTVFHPAASLCSLAGELAVERIAVFVVAVSFWSVDLFVIQVFCEDLLEDCLSRNIFTSCQKMPFDDRLDMVEYMQKNP